jgi:hypothetical protein
MANKLLSWVIFFIVASGLVALTWNISPKLRNVLPEKVVKSSENFVSAARGDFSFANKASEPSTQKTIFVYVNKDGSAYTNSTQLASESTSSNETITAKEPKAQEKPERHPFQLGIRRVHSMQAKWAVLQETTPVETLSGEVMGNAPAGSIFFVEKRISTDSDTIYEGRFNSTKMTKTVRIKSGYVVPFSGDYNKLSEKRKTALKKYYELSGKAEERKKEVLKNNLSKSPYLAKAAELLRKYNTAIKRLEGMKNASEDFRREATYKLSQLKDKIQQLNQKHKEWKESHSAELNDYTNDEKYVEIIAEREKFHDEIPGLAY